MCHLNYSNNPNFGLFHLLFLLVSISIVHCITYESFLPSDAISYVPSVYQQQQYGERSDKSISSLEQNYQKSQNFPNSVSGSGTGQGQLHKRRRRITKIRVKSSKNRTTTTEKPMTSSTIQTQMMDYTDDNWDAEQQYLHEMKYRNYYDGHGQYQYDNYNNYNYNPVNNERVDQNLYSNSNSNYNNNFKSSAAGSSSGKKAVKDSKTSSGSFVVSAVLPGVATMMGQNYDQVNAIKGQGQGQGQYRHSYHAVGQTGSSHNNNNHGWGWGWDNTNTNSVKPAQSYGPSNYYQKPSQTETQIYAFQVNQKPKKARHHLEKEVEEPWFKPADLNLYKTLLGTAILKHGKIIFWFKLMFVTLIFALLSLSGIKFTPIVFPLAILPIAFIGLILFVPIAIAFFPLVATGLAGEVRRRRSDVNLKDSDRIQIQRLENMLNELMKFLPDFNMEY